MELEVLKKINSSNELIVCIFVYLSICAHDGRANLLRPFASLGTQTKNTFHSRAPSKHASRFIIIITTLFSSPNQTKPSRPTENNFNKNPRQRVGLEKMEICCVQIIQSSNPFLRSVPLLVRVSENIPGEVLNYLIGRANKHCGQPLMWSRRCRRRRFDRRGQISGSLTSGRQAPLARR